MTRFPKRRWFLIILLVFLAIYTGSYLVLSVQGRFEPAVIGLNGVKSYKWAPRGFVTDFRWNTPLRVTYGPLYLLDTWLWHTGRDADPARYPVNEVPREEIWRVYEAWSR